VPKLKGRDQLFRGCWIHIGQIFHEDLPGYFGR
jgi:hypothetical protein